MERPSAQSIANGETSPKIEWVPFVTGRRPIDEASFPGLGSSDKVALILDSVPAAENRMYLLYRVSNMPAAGDDPGSYEVRLTMSLTGPWGDARPDPLPRWSGRVVPPVAFERRSDEALVLCPAHLMEARDRCLVVELSPCDDFLPHDSDDSFSFENLFLQRVRADLALLRGGEPVSASQMMIDVCDARRVGSLYRRVMERVIAPDTQAQARLHGLESLHLAYHSWFPVLLIGSNKADLYMRALIGDIVRKQRHLTDPGWLLKVGVYLELITSLGIFEAVKDDLGDLLSQQERKAFEASPWFTPIREAVNPERWKRVWALRSIAMYQDGAISPVNLLAKKKATLAFLEAHHEDLKHAIRLAGVNEHNAQETWHRVFRDAERAVLRTTEAAFPELATFPPKAREFILWHQKGKIRGLSLPAVSSWFGDQDGLYPSACHQYRSSMNHVAQWAKREALMDHAGPECIPATVSLLTTVMEGNHVRLAQLQRRDGYGEKMDLPVDLAPVGATSEGVVALLRSVAIFSMLTDDEIERLAATARPIELGPVERIIIQGRKGTSLFVVGEGRLEVMVRQKDGVDLPVAILEPGSVFGEMSLLTGQRRTATVRSIESTVVYEIGQQQLGPILQSRPSAVYELAAVMAPRLYATAGASQGYEEKHIASLGRKIRSFLLS